MRKLLLFALAFGLLALPARADMKWGSLAISDDTGTVGRATDMTTQEAAETAAVADCYLHGGRKCKKTGWTHGQYCAAVAVKRYTDNRGVAWGSATAATLSEARKKALDECAKYAEETCDEVVIDNCTTN